MSDYPPIADLVPHGAPIRMLDALVDWSPGHAVCALTVWDDNPFVRDGRLDSVVHLETMAQAVAACLGYEAFLGGAGTRVGMIVGCRSLALLRPSVPVGARLVVEARKLRGTESVSRFRGEVRDAAGLIATADMTLFHAEKPPQEAP